MLQRCSLSSAQLSEVISADQKGQWSSHKTEAYDKVSPLAVSFRTYM